MQKTPYELGYSDALELMKVANIAPYGGSGWMPPGAAAPRYDIPQGSAAYQQAKAKGFDKAPPGLLRKGWQRFRGLPLKAQLGIGAGAAGLLGLGGLLMRKHLKQPGSSYAHQDRAPELQAAAYQQPYYR